MNIVVSSSIPDGKYFASNDVAPKVEGDTLTVFTGKGGRRTRWGTQYASKSTIVVNEANFVAVHVSFTHQHRGQQWYYFIDGERRTWGQLSDDLRSLVLANRTKAPSGAKLPGRLKTERKAAVPTLEMAYKLVAVADGKFVSLYDKVTEYKLGKRLAQKAYAGHGGGYYAHTDERDARDLADSELASGAAQLALLQVEISGTIVRYAGGKVAATYVKPVRVVEIINIQPEVIGAS